MPYNLLELANAHLESGDVDDALATLAQHLKARPYDEEARRLRAGILMRMPDAESHRAAAEDLLALSDPTADDYMQLTIVLEMLGQSEAAEDAMAWARALRPHDDLLIQHHVLLLIAHRHHAEARALLDSMPETWVWLQLSGDLATEYDGPERAVQDYSAALWQLEKQAASEDKGFFANLRADLLSRRARVYMTHHYWDAADADYAAADALMPGDPMFPFMRGLIAAHRGDLNSALGWCGGALASAPPFLARQMADMLAAEPTYRGLAMLLLQGDADV